MAGVSTRVSVNGTDTALQLAATPGATLNASMRVALISDLHGNAVALRAVLADIRSLGVDRIVCLGDVATLGPRPHEVIGLLRELRCPCIRGNHDDFLIDPELIAKYTDAPPIVQAVLACRESLGRAEIEFVATFQPTLDLDLDGTRLALFHGTPRSNTEDILATTPANELDDALGGERPTVMAGGHTHIQMLRQHHGTLVVNPGSVGLPFQAYAHHGPPRVLAHAEYGVVESVRGSVQVGLRRVPVERATLLASLEGWDNPLREYLRVQYSGV
jgi:putative phosphoesterase